MLHRIDDLAADITELDTRIDQLITPLATVADQVAVAGRVDLLVRGSTEGHIRVVAPCRAIRGLRWPSS
jgi:hypothetical protein